MGLGHGVWCARELVGDEPFAVLLADDLVMADTPCQKQMVEVYEEPAAMWSRCKTCRRTYQPLRHPRGRVR